MVRVRRGIFSQRPSPDRRLVRRISSNFTVLKSATGFKASSAHDVLPACCPGTTHAANFYRGRGLNGPLPGAMVASIRQCLMGRPVMTRILCLLIALGTIAFGGSAVRAADLGVPRYNPPPPAPPA